MKTSALSNQKFIKKDIIFKNNLKNTSDAKKISKHTNDAKR
jgi:hypothetical protein